MSKHLSMLVACCVMSIALSAALPMIPAVTVSSSKLKNGCNGKCNEGFYLNQSLYQCISCPANCKVCNDSSTCTECQQGSFMNEHQNCVACGVSGCLECGTDGKCNKCYSGYFLSENKTTCSYCGYPCDVCASETTCASCPKNDIWTGSYLLNGTCTYCPDGCLACESPLKCTSCRSGYTLSKSKCVSCSSIDTECIACDVSQSQCTKCQDGFYLLNNTCLECVAGCRSCSDEGSCDVCQDAYFLNANKGCTPCMEGCQNCTVATRCDKCYDSYEWDSDKKACNSCFGNPWIHPHPLPRIPLGPGPVIIN